MTQATLRTVGVICAALFLATTMSASASAKGSRDSQNGYGTSRHGSTYGHQRYGHHRYGHHGYGHHPYDNRRYGYWHHGYRHRPYGYHGGYHGGYGHGYRYPGNLGYHLFGFNRPPSPYYGYGHDNGRR